MNAKRLAVVAVAIVLVAAVILIAAISVQDGRTRSEKLILTAGDLTGMNATQQIDPFPNSYHPDARAGSEAAGSDFWVDVDGWSLYVDCLLVLYNSSSLASQRFQGLVLGDDYAEINAGDGCQMGGYYNDPTVFRVYIYATVLQNDTITYFVFTAYPPRDGSLNSPVPAPSAQVTEAMENIINAKVDKIRQGT